MISDIIAGLVRVTGEGSSGLLEAGGVPGCHSGDKVGCGKLRNFSCCLCKLDLKVEKGSHLTSPSC